MTSMAWPRSTSVDVDVDVNVGVGVGVVSDIEVMPCARLINVVFLLHKFVTPAI